MKNPQATFGELIDWHDYTAKQHTSTDLDPERFNLWVTYMETVTDTEAILWGWLQAEQAGYAYWSIREKDWQIR